VSSSQGNPPRNGRTVSLVTLGCARNEVDSEELAARLDAAGWTLADRTGADGDDGGGGAAPDVVLVNTCGFIQAAKEESIDQLLGASAAGTKVVAAGCLAERYGAGLAEALPEAQVLSFDDYGDIAARLDAVVDGQRWPAHAPRDRRRLLPISPAGRPAVGAQLPGHATGIPDLPPGVAPASGPRIMRRRLDGGVVAPLKIASGCDRRCSFCAIPAFRGAFISRPPQDLVAEAQWLAGRGVRELLLVSENSTSYGKDLGDLRLLETLLPELAAVPGIERVRVSYLQPAEVRPGLVQVMTSTPGVAAYFDLSFQHASGSVLRAMRRFGDRERFCGLLDQIRAAAPGAGVRSNFIVGFPGETAADVDELQRFLSDARLDAIGIFGYSDEDGTEAAALPGQVAADEIARRVEDLADLAEELMSQRAAERIGETATVLIQESLADGSYTGLAEHQAPEVDGSTTVLTDSPLTIGDLVRVTVTGSEGVDLVAAAAGVAAPLRPAAAAKH
jgi:ribosomal protein S12 methylthiotransferase